MKNLSLIRFTSLTNNKLSFFFKRNMTYEQKLINIVNSGNIHDLNHETYSLIFDSSIIEKGSLTNFADKTIQALPHNMYSFKKALNPAGFFKDNLHLNITANPNNYSSIQHLNQRTNTICEIVIAETMNRKHNDVVSLTNGNILNKKLSYSQTGQNNCDYLCAKVLHNGKIYYYYADLKITDKAKFFKNIALMHPQKLVFCQFHYVGGLTDNCIFNTQIKDKLIIGCQHYMYNHISSNTALASYETQLNSELKVFDVNPTVENYNSLVVAPWRIFTVPSIVKYLNA